MLFISTNNKFQAIRPFEFVRIDRGRLLFIGSNPNEVLLLIVVGESFTDVCCGRMAILAGCLHGRCRVQHRIMQFDSSGHTLVIIINNGKEDWIRRKTRYLLDLRQMLMLKIQSVDTGRCQFIGTVFIFIISDHLLTAAGITGQGEGCERVVPGQNFELDQRRCAGNDASCVTAGVCQALRRTDSFSLLAREFREAVGPVIVRSVRCRCINHADIRIFNQGYRLAGTIIWQAKEYNVCRIQELLTFLEIVSLIFINAEEFEVIPLSDSVIDLKTGSAGLTVNVDFCFHRLLFSFLLTSLFLASHFFLFLTIMSSIRNHVSRSSSPSTPYHTSG